VLPGEHTSLESVAAEEIYITPSRCASVFSRWQEIFFVAVAKVSADKAPFLRRVHRALPISVVL